MLNLSLPEAVLDRYVGGKGVGAYLLAQHQDPKAAPYAPTNPLIFVVGPLTGTQAPSMRSVVVFQSPVTHLFTDSYFGGFFGQELKAAGYDGMVITGAAVAALLPAPSQPRIMAQRALRFLYSSL